MTELYSVLWNLVVAVGSLLLVLAILAAGFAVACTRQLEKFIFELPWLRWMTIEEIATKGFSPFWAILILPSLHDVGELEVRPRSDWELLELEQYCMEKVGFDYLTIPYYEFRLTTKHRKRKKPKPQDLLKSWSAVPVPIPARA